MRKEMEVEEVEVPEEAILGARARRGGAVVLARWLAGAPGVSVRERDAIAELHVVGDFGGDEQLSVLVVTATASRSGTLKKRYFEAGARIFCAEESAQAPAIAALEFCPHAIVYSGLCAVCGEQPPSPVLSRRTAQPRQPLLHQNQPQARDLGARHAPKRRDDDDDDDDGDNDDNEGARNSSIRAADAFCERQLSSDPALPSPPLQILEGSSASVHAPMARAPPLELVGSTRVDVAYSGGELSVSVREAERVSSLTAARMERERRLFLVLDIDHTLLHAVSAAPSAATALALRRVADLHPHIAEQIIALNVFPLGAQPPPSAAASSALSFHVKLRPGLMKFLRGLGGKYELHIYTMGTRAYADAVARVIDPEHALFQGRIVSRDDFAEGAVNQKSLRRVFPCDDSMVLVVDDREDVWHAAQPRHITRQPAEKRFRSSAPPPPPPPLDGNDAMPNLLKARPYCFFDGLEEAYDRTSRTGVVSTSSCTPSASSAPATTPVSPEKSSKSATGDEEQRVEDAANALLQRWLAAEERDRNHLAKLSNVLEKCHERFYAARDEMRDKVTEQGARSRVANAISAGNVMRELRRSVLQGCVLVFSGVFAVGTDVRSAWLWRMAERFGAECHERMNARVSHVVLDARRGADTEKARLAKERSDCVWLVTIRWLLRSCEEFERASELECGLESEEQTTSAAKRGEAEKEEDVVSELAARRAEKDRRRLAPTGASRPAGAGTARGASGADEDMLLQNLLEEELRSTAD